MLFWMVVIIVFINANIFITVNNVIFYVIGKMCGLLKPQHKLEKVVGLTGEMLRQRVFDLFHFSEHLSRQKDKVLFN